MDEDQDNNTSNDLADTDVDEEQSSTPLKTCRTPGCDKKEHHLGVHGTDNVLSANTSRPRRNSESVTDRNAREALEETTKSTLRRQQSEERAKQRQQTAAAVTAANKKAAAITAAAQAQKESDGRTRTRATTYCAGSCRNCKDGPSYATCAFQHCFMHNVKMESEAQRINHYFTNHMEHAEHD
eukprot:gene31091-8455_t